MTSNQEKLTSKSKSKNIFEFFYLLFRGSCEVLPHLIQFIHRPGKVKCAMMNEIGSLEWRREDLSFSCIKLLA